MKNFTRIHPRDQVDVKTHWALFVFITLVLGACAIPVFRASASMLAWATIVAPTTTARVPVGTPPPAGQDLRPKIGYQNYEAPGVLTNVSSTSQGPAGHTVEYLGHDAGEPSVGNKWNTGVTNFQSDLQTLFIKFDDSCPANG